MKPETLPEELVQQAEGRIEFLENLLAAGEEQLADMEPGDPDRPALERSQRLCREDLEHWQQKRAYWAKLAQGEVVDL